MRPGWMVLAGTAALSAALAAADSGGLGNPTRIAAGGRPLSVEIGHAAPCVADIDGDGKAELLVGQFGDGKLRIYPNQGTPAAPRFDSYTWFQAGGTTGKVPSG